MKSNPLTRTALTLGLAAVAQWAAESPAQAAPREPGHSASASKHATPAQRPVPPASASLRDAAQEARRLTAADMIDWLAQMKGEQCTPLSPRERLEQIAQIPPQTLVELFEEAEAQYRAGQAVRALEAFQALAELAPNDARVWLRIGNLHWKQGAVEPALQAYLRARPLESDAASSEPHPLRLARSKASINLIELLLEQARAAAAGLETHPLDAELRRRYSALREQLGLAADVPSAADAAAPTLAEPALRPRGRGSLLSSAHARVPVTYIGSGGQPASAKSPAPTESGVEAQ